MDYFIEGSYEHDHFINYEHQYETVVPCRMSKLYAAQRKELRDNFFSSIGNGGYGNSWIELKRDKFNDYDPDAVKVMVKGEMFGTLGYVGMQYAKSIHHILKKPHTVYIMETDSGNDYELYLVIAWSENSSQKAQQE